MARPIKVGCDYFPLDCNFFIDRKVRLLRGDYGAKAEAVLIRLWCMVYGDQGYYLNFTEEDAALLADSMGAGTTKGQIEEIVRGSCVRGIFDEAVYTQFSVLTSKAVQKRYLEIKKQQNTITLNRDYWLLEPSDFKANEQELLLKLQFFRVIDGKTQVIAEETTVNFAEMPQRKEKESKGKQSKEKKSIIEAFSSFAGEDKELLDALTAYDEYRRTGDRHKEWTLLAANRMMGRLNDLCIGRSIKNKSGYMCSCINKSIISGWKGIFDDKDFVDSEPVRKKAAVHLPEAEITDGMSFADMF